MKHLRRAGWQSLFKWAPWLGVLSSFLGLLLFQNCSGFSAKGFNLSTLESMFFPGYYRGKAFHPSSLRRLSRSQINVKINKYFKADQDWTANFSPELDSEGYYNYSGLRYSQSFFSDMEALAESVAEASIPKAGEVFGCDSVTRSCLETFLNENSDTLFNIHSSMETQQGLLDLYSEIEENFSQEEALKAFIEAVIRMPTFAFWYEGEVDSSLLLSRDDQLNQIRLGLSNGVLSQEEVQALSVDMGDGPGWEVQLAEELTESEAFADVFADFLVQWLEVYNFHTVSKADEVFDVELKGEMIEETRNFARMIVRSPASSVKDLMTSTKTVLSPRVAAIYGVEEAESAAEYDLGYNRPGILTRLAFLTAKGDAEQSSPIGRGAFFLGKVFCETTPSVPRDVNITLQNATPEMTKREAFEAHSQFTACISCHTRLDPPGFAMEVYDRIGQFRTMEKNRPINTAVKIEYLVSSQAEVQDTNELMHFVANAPEFHQCFVKNAFTYLMGRPYTSGDSKELKEAYDHFVQSDYSIKSLFSYLASSETYRKRER